MKMDEKNKEIEISEPRMVKSHDVKLDAEYAEWIAEVKHRYRYAQVKAAVKVNGEKLLFNWQMGRDLVQKKAEERWGAGVVEQVSLDLKREFPNEDGFSTSNLWYMKKSCFIRKTPTAHWRITIIHKSRTLKVLNLSNCLHIKKSCNFLQSYKKFFNS